jgi:hypothetical protein
MVEAFRHCRHIGYSSGGFGTKILFLLSVAPFKCLFEPLRTQKAGVAAVIVILAALLSFSECNFVQIV